MPDKHPNVDFTRSTLNFLVGEDYLRVVSLYQALGLGGNGLIVPFVLERDCFGDVEFWRISRGGGSS